MEERLHSIIDRFAEVEQSLNDPNTVNSPALLREASREYKSLLPIVTAGREYLDVVEQVRSNRALIDDASTDADLRDMAYEALLPVASEDPESLRKLWTTIPPADRVSPGVAAIAANAFMKIGRQQDAADIVEKALAVQWDARLLRAYRNCAAPEGSATLLAQIEHGEHWSRERPNDAELALVLGVLCVRQKLWGKAQRYLEQALAGNVDRAIAQEAHLRLAQMHETLNQVEAAATHYRQCALTTARGNVHRSSP